MQAVNLVVVSPLKYVQRGNNRILLTRKFLDGMALYKEYWKGPLTLLCEPSDRASDNLDNCEVDLDRAPFRLIPGSRLLSPPSHPRSGQGPARPPLLTRGSGWARGAFQRRQTAGLSAPSG